MGRATVSLEEWIFLASSLEQSAVRRAAAGGVDDDLSSGAGEGCTARDASLTYVKQALKVSLLLLGRLCSAGAPHTPSSDESPCGAAFRPEDVRLENFTVEIDAETVSGVNIRDSLQLGAAGNHHELSEAHLKNIGLLLHSIFCRGESPPLPLGPKSGGDEEDSFLPSRKRVDRTDRNPHERQIARDDLPSSICRLVLDLLQSGEAGSSNPPFESLGDIISELKQILEGREVYLCSPGDPSPINQSRPDFGEGVLFGRTEELRIIIRAVVRASSLVNNGNTTVNDLVLISGDAGSGKSRLVESVQGPSSNRGFVRLCAKFDQMPQQQPLSTIAGVFENFFQRVELSRQNNALDRNMEDIVASIERNVPVSGLMVLINLIPSIRDLFPNIPVLRRVVSDPDLSAFGEEQEAVPRDAGNIIPDDNDASASHAESSRNRLHFFFRMLVRAMSSPEHPVLLFLDDLQWADQCSLELISSLLLDSDHIDRLRGDDAAVSQCILVIGAYRTNEVDESHPLSPLLENFDASPNVCVTKINLSGMPREITNAMLSHALGLPLRLTRRLTDVFMAKTLGNPFHIQEFALSLWEENILHFSIGEQRWIWDIETAWALSVDESIAELLAKKLSQLPENAQLALKVVSCFGSHIVESMFPLLSPEYDIGDGLRRAVKENILGNRGGCYKFVHDILQKASYDLMDEEERLKHHHSIGMKLISSLPPSEGSDLCPIEFIAIGHINRSMASEASEGCRLHFAQMNLKAGKRSIEASDFESALSFMEHGIAFLPEARWASQYRLSLSLFENAALACFSLTRTSKMKIFLDEVFEHADCLEDKLRGYYLVIRQLSGSERGLDDASEKLFHILDQLGEKFPPHVTPDLVQNEMSSVQILMKDLKREDILAARRQMMDKRKIWTMKFLSRFILILFFSRPQYVPLVATRIIKISASFGYLEDSALGFIGLGLALNKFGAIENGCYFGKLALSLLQSLNAGASCTAKVNFWYCLMFAHWTEPTQATIDSLGTNTNLCLSAGEIEYAGLSCLTRCRLSFLAGQDLSRLEKDCTFLVSMTTRMKLKIMLIYAGLLRLTIHKLIGVDQNQLDRDTFSGGVPMNNEEELHHYAMEHFGERSHLIRYVKNKQFSQMLLAFWFKRYKEVCDISMQHSDQMVLGFGGAMKVFYEGLAAFHLARKYSKERKWMEVGEKAISAFQDWLRCNSVKWNFENRLLLLEAEKCFTENDKESAQEKYEAAIKSAQQHGFINEEGLAYDFCSTFYKVSGNTVKAKRCIAKARACYEKWGAFAIAHLLDDTTDSYY